MAEPMTIHTPDKFGYTPDLSLLGRSYRHSGSGDTYRIAGFTFIADTDEWGLRYLRKDCPVCFTRSVAGFFGTREGVNRFLPMLDTETGDDVREEVARILETIAKDGLPGPRDLDVALDAIFATIQAEC